VLDVLLAVVVGLVLYAVSARAPGAGPGSFPGSLDVLRLLLVSLALLVDLLALGAIGTRIAEFGFTANRTLAPAADLVTRGERPDPEGIVCGGREWSHQEQRGQSALHNGAGLPDRLRDRVAPPDHPYHSLTVLERHRRFRPLHPVATVAALVGTMFLVSAPGAGYRFYGSSSDAPWIPEADDARRWEPTAWGPGGILVWHIQDVPEWSPHFVTAGDFIPLFETALEVWGSISTADIRMRVEGLAQRAVAELDGRNLVAVGTEEPGRAFAQAWSRRNSASGQWRRYECDVIFGANRLEGFANTDRRHHLTTIIHELGHCIGLRHAAVTPTPRGRTPRGHEKGWRISSIWQKDPVMSYGFDIDNQLTEDDVVGASLVRPRPSWLRTTGSLSGRLTRNGQPAAFVSVHLLRDEDGRARPSVQVFSNDRGEFLAEGLRPGRYLLWVHPMFRQSAHDDLLEGDPSLDVSDLTNPQTFVVQAGHETAAGEFVLRRGRNPP
jgi:hypothetical protein